MSAQLPLALRWPAHQRFESFVLGDNATALRLAESAALHAAPTRVFLAGTKGSGRTHLLIAACAAAVAADRCAQYLDLSAMRAPRAPAIRLVHGSQLLAVDNVEAIAGDREAEHALFDLYNRCRAEDASLLLSAVAAPAQLGIELPDLVSRLASCTQASLQLLDEPARRGLVQQRAQARGIQLDDSVLDWMFTRHARDLGSLMDLLERIDRAALAAQRRVTVPFLRALLAVDPVG